MQPDPDRLRKLPLFESLTLEQCQELATLTEEREVDAGQRLTPEGSSGYTFFVIEEGTAEVLHDDTLIRTMGPGDHFGELAILGDGRRTATVVSTSPMKLVAIFGTVFRQIEADMPEVAQRIEDVVRARSGE